MIISEPETVEHTLTSSDDLMILSTDGLYRTYKKDYVVKRVLELRQANYTLAQIAERIVEECLKPEKGKEPCNDNVTLMLVDMAAYYLASLRKPLTALSSCG